MKVEEIIKEILEIINNPKVGFDEMYFWNVKNVVYSGGKIEGTSKTDLGKNPSFTIHGKENIDRYNNLYNELLKKLVKNKRISLKSFQDITQNLIFENAFTEENVRAIIEGVTEHKTEELFKIYGLKMSSNVFKKGKYTFINKKHIADYVLEKNPLVAKNSISKSYVISHLVNSDKETGDFVYISIESNTFDDTFSLEQATSEMDRLLSALNFMFGSQNSFVSFSFIPTRRVNKFQINYEQDYLNYSGELFYGGTPILIDGPDNLKWHDKIWDIFSLDSPNEIQQRIIRAVEWTSKAYVEKDENIKRVEIAFAFEALLQSDQQSFVKESIVALISEHYAFINGKDLEDRKNKEKDFRKFYQERSGIAHGGIARFETNVNDYFLMVISTIYHLLMDNRFSDCKTSSDLYGLIKDMKYTLS